MAESVFWEKFWLVVLDKGLLALVVLVAGLYLNKVLEAFKGKLSREQEFLKTANQAVVDLTKKLAAGSHLISWLAWNATEAEASLTDKDFTSYDKAMIAVLSELVGLQASVAALSASKFEALSKFAEQLYERDVEVGKARDLFRTKDPQKVQRSIEILKAAYTDSLGFDKALLAAVTGLLESPSSHE
jgi:hypothetical protein